MTFEDSILGFPVESAQMADLLDDFWRLCRAGTMQSEALRQAASAARPGLRAVIDVAASQVANGMAISEALAASSHNLPPLVAPALRAWERNGQRDEDLKTLMREMRRLGEIEQRNTFLHIQAFIDAASRRERLQIGAREICSARKRINATRGGVGRQCRGTMRWTDLFASLWRCNVPISEALEAAGDGCGNGYYRHVLHRAAERTREGVALSVCLAETRLMPVGLIERLRTGETSGRMDETLDEFARVMEVDAGRLGLQSAFMRRILPAILVCCAVALVMFGATMGSTAIGVIVALIFLPVAFALWKIVFRLSISGEPDLGIGNRLRRRNRPVPQAFIATRQRTQPGIGTADRANIRVNEDLANLNPVPPEKVRS